MEFLKSFIIGLCFIVIVAIDYFVFNLYKKKPLNVLVILYTLSMICYLFIRTSSVFFLYFCTGMLICFWSFYYSRVNLEKKEGIGQYYGIFLALFLITLGVVSKLIL